MVLLSNAVLNRSASGVSMSSIAFHMRARCWFGAYPPVIGGSLRTPSWRYHAAIFARRKALMSAAARRRDTSESERTAMVEGGWPGGVASSAFHRVFAHQARCHAVYSRNGADGSGGGLEGRSSR